MEVAYGTDITTHEDQSLRAVKEAVDLTKRAVTPGAFLVNIIPIRTYHQVSEDNHVAQLVIGTSQIRSRVGPRSGVQNLRKGGSPEL